jgi:hypothetical protein
MHQGLPLHKQEEDLITDLNHHMVEEEWLQKYQLKGGLGCWEYQDVMEAYQTTSLHEESVAGVLLILQNWVECSCSRNMGLSHFIPKIIVESSFGWSTIEVTLITRCQFIINSSGSTRSPIDILVLSLKNKETNKLVTVQLSAACIIRMTSELVTILEIRGSSGHRKDRTMLETMPWSDSCW